MNRYWIYAIISIAGIIIVGTQFGSDAALVTFFVWCSAFVLGAKIQRLENGQDH